MRIMRTVRFDSLEIGTDFVATGATKAELIATNQALGLDRQEVIFRKKSNSSADAFRSGAPNSFLATRFRPTAEVATVLPDLTPEEIAAEAEARRVRTLEWFVRHLTSTVEDCDEKLTRFKTRFEADAADAFTWSMDALEASATRDVYCRMQAWWLTMEGKPEQTLETVRKEVIRQTMNGAKYVQNSSSPTANLVDVYKTAAWAKLADWIDIHID